MYERILCYDAIYSDRDIKDLMFKLIHNVLHKKDKSLKFKEEDFSFFLFQRWLSMASAINAKIVNETSNRMYYWFEDNEKWYKLFLTILPKTSYKKINYLKKIKKDKANKMDQEEIDTLANNLEMSKREVINCLNILKTQKQKG